MISYQFISDLFTSILYRSSSIEGRFFVSDKNGNEINSDNLGQVLTDATTQLQQQKYPLGIMLPPVSTGEMNSGRSWQDYAITIFFLRTTYYDGSNQIEEPNPNTQTSMRGVIKDWEQMATLANDFAYSLVVTMRTPGTSAYFRVKGSTKRITPVTKVGTDRVSGVMLNFMISLFTGCEPTDIDIAAIVASLPATLGFPNFSGYDQFAGSLSRVFTLTTEPAANTNKLVFLNGVLISSGYFDLSRQTLTLSFDTYPADTVSVLYFITQNQ